MSCSEFVSAVAVEVEIAVAAATMLAITITLNIFCRFCLMIRFILEIFSSVVSFFVLEES
jgi:hypothetical protein